LYGSPALSDLLAMIFLRVSFVWRNSLDSCCPVSVHLSVRFTYFSHLVYIYGADWLDLLTL
jgi:hypothetical protein